MFNFKKMLASILMVVIIVVLFAGISFAEVQKTGTITGSNLNVRENPSTTAKVLTQLSKGDQVTILESLNGWHKISFGSTKGWVSAQYVSVNESKSIGIGTVNGSNLNVRVDPDTSARVLTQLAKGTEVTLMDSNDDWYYISYKDIEGWVFAEYITPKDGSIGAGTVTGDNVNVRSSASTSASVITQLDSGDGVSVLAISGDWYKIKTSDGYTGWIYKQYVKLKGSTTSRADDEISSNASDSANDSDDSSLGSQIVSYAKKYLGVPYEWGGASPSGFDCSGFTYYVFKHFGIDLERVSTNQAKQGVKVKKSELQMGDLVFFDTNGGNNVVNHVGIYVGRGNFIQASSGRNSHKVVISDLTSGFYADSYMTARRVTK